MFKVIENQKRILLLFFGSCILFYLILVLLNINEKNFLSICSAFIMIMSYFFIRMYFDKAIMSTDKNEEKNMQLEINEERFRIYFNNAPLGVFVIDRNGNLIEVNEATVTMFGYSEQELLNNSIFNLILEEKAYVNNLLKSLHKNKRLNCEEKIVNANNKKLYAKINAVKVNENRYLVFIENIDSKKIKEKKIKYLSYHDQLTGLYNRRYFEIKIERLSSSQRYPVSIVIGDLDGLKNVNDNYGHKMGDRYIKKAAEIIHSVVRTEDIIARIGGDEFALLLPETDSNSAELICDRIYNECRKFNENTKLPEPLEVSLGYAVADEDNRNLDEIFEQADQKMYKEKGRNIFLV